jgi:hypothetical protein
VKHRELINASVAGSPTFTVQQTFALNPGIAATFPWLSVTAANWEQYQIHKLDFVYLPIAPTSTKGDLMLSPDYDASDPQPATEVQASDNSGTVEDVCWKVIRASLDVRAMMGLGPRRYVRTAAVAGDIKTFDVGKMFLITNNEADTSPIGKLWVEYDIEFFVPQNSPSTSTAPLSTSALLIASDQALTTATPATANFAVIAGNDPLGIGPGSSGVFTPPAGSYRLAVFMTAHDTATEAFTFVAQIKKNTTVVMGATGQDGSVAASSIPLSMGAVLNCNGSDTFSVTVDCIGAAGTLTLAGGLCSMQVSLA